MVEEKESKGQLELSPVRCQELDGYSLEFSPEWVNVTKENRNQPLVTWYPVNFNATVWGGHPTIRTWKYTLPQDSDHGLVCNVYKLRKEPGIGLNFYSETLMSHREIYPDFVSSERGKLDIDGRSGKWFLGSMLITGVPVQVFVTSFCKDKYIYMVYFWGTDTLVKDKFDELQKIVQSMKIS